MKVEYLPNLFTDRMPHESAPKQESHPFLTIRDTVTLSQGAASSTSIPDLREIFRASRLGDRNRSNAAPDMFISLTGCPGAGKSTHGKMLAERYGIPHISVGTILRKEVAKNTPLGQKVKSYVERGDLAPTEVVTEVVRNRLTEPDCSHGFILDGYPRQMEDVEALKAICSDLGIKNVRVIGIEVDPETVIERVKNRRVCDNGHQYDLVQSPPRREGACDIDGLPIYQRDDDTPETIRHRFDIFRNETVPVIDHFKKTGNYTAINGNGSIEDVQEALHALFEPSEEKKAA